MTRTATAAAASVVVLPALSIAGAPVHASPLQITIAVALAAAGFGAASVFPSGRTLAVAGFAIVAVCAWLLAQVSFPASGWVVAPALGFGTGMILPLREFRTPRRAAALTFAVPIALAGVLTGVRLVDRDAAMAAGAAIAACAAAAAIWRPAGRVASMRRVMAGVVTGGLLAFGSVVFVGATTPRVTWFGDLVSHGPRQSEKVAITFDDGPNPPYTLEIRDILDSYGVKATFFTVGKALDARPDVSRALVDDGMLLGNHSYHHDAISWLDPGYPELKETQDAFQRNLGVCPAFYRPPHGSHTPFMAHVISDQGMTMVTWDVSAGDWATTDGDVVARRVLDSVRPGSIILLHDGIDGKIGANRSVILGALPQILEALRQRGLQPVTLDELLGKRGYLQTC